MAVVKFGDLNRTGTDIGGGRPCLGAMPATCSAARSGRSTSGSKKNSTRLPQCCVATRSGSGARRLNGAPRAASPPTAAARASLVDAL